MPAIAKTDTLDFVDTGLGEDCIPCPSTMLLKACSPSSQTIHTGD